MRGIGVDICKSARVLRLWRLRGDRFINKFLAEDEIRIFNKINASKQRQTFLAGRWASKEAVYKAVSQASPKMHLRFKQIAILNAPNGIPYVQLRRNGEEYRIILSISHEEDYAVAFALVN